MKYMLEQTILTLRSEAMSLVGVQGAENSRRRLLEWAAMLENGLRELAGVRETGS